MPNSKKGMGSSQNCSDVPSRFDTVLRQLEDIVIDIPQAPLHVSNFIEQAISDNVLTLTQLKTLLRPLLEGSETAQQTGSDITAEVLLLLAENTVQP